MKSKAMVFVMSCMFLLGMAGNVLAVTDTTGDNLKADIDLLSASVVTSGKADPAQTPDTINIGVKMNAGSHLPGAIIFDFDVDNDTATGGGSIITGIPAGNCGAQACKAPAGDGFDFSVVLVLRTQGDSSNLSLASGCSGAGVQCTVRGAPTSCDEGTCYQLGSPCGIGDPDCYEVTPGGACNNCTPDITSYPLDIICGSSGKDCTKPLIKGEYYVGFGQQNEVMVGNVLVRNTYNINNETELCAELPWGLMVTNMFVAINDAADPNNPLFDPNYATDNPPKYQVSLFYDETFHTGDEDDLFTLPGLNVDVSDWMPDTARAADGEYNQYDLCAHNSAGGYGDLNVDANDVGDFLAEFGRSVFSRPCPTCKN